MVTCLVGQSCVLFGEWPRCNILDLIEPLPLLETDYKQSQSNLLILMDFDLTPSMLQSSQSIQVQYIINNNYYYTTYYTYAYTAA